MLYDLGSWLKYVAGLRGLLGKPLQAAGAEPDSETYLSLAAQMQGLPCSTPAYQHMAQIGISLLDLAVSTGSAYLANILMQGLFIAGHSYAWVSAQFSSEISTDACSGSSRLLQFAVSSCSTQMVDLVMGWEAEYGSSGVWLAQMEVSSGGISSKITALHLAAAQDDGGVMARHLFARFPEARAAWDVPAGWGYTPRGLFAAAGHSTVGMAGTGCLQADTGVTTEILNRAQELETPVHNAAATSMEASSVQRDGEDYHTWLSRRDIVISKQLSVIAIGLSGEIYLRLLCGMHFQNIQIMSDHLVDCHKSHCASFFVVLITSRKIVTASAV